MLASLLVVREAHEACLWLRAAGFPQYVDMFEGEPYTVGQALAVCSLRRDSSCVRVPLQGASFQSTCPSSRSNGTMPSWSRQPLMSWSSE